jgi:hypothetical protein
MDNISEGIKLEAKVKVHEAVLRSPPIAMDLRVLVSNWHCTSRDFEHASENHHNTVHIVCPLYRKTGQYLRHPSGLVGGVYVDWLAVKDYLDVVLFLVPLDGLASAEVEAVVTEAETKGLYPREGAFIGGVVVADEVGVDVEVSIGDDTEVLVPLAMEVECNAITTREARIAARITRVDSAPCGSNSKLYRC